MIEFFRHGLTSGKVHVDVLNFSSSGFLDLKEQLFSSQEHMPRRLDMIQLSLLGWDYKTIGNVLFIPNGRDFEANFTDLGYSTERQKIKEDHLKTNHTCLSRCSQLAWIWTREALVWDF